MHQHLGPDQQLYIQDIQVIQPLRPIPSSKYKEVFFNESGTVVGSRRRIGPIPLYLSPLLSHCVQTMEIIEVVPPIPSPEYVDLLVVAVSCMHIAGTRRLSQYLQVQPSECCNVQDVHVICGERSLTQPSSNNVQSLI